MRLKRRYKANTQFNMASMTDIIFLLLLFFMLTVSFGSASPSPESTKGLTIDLPTSHSADIVIPQIQVTITAQLDYYVDNVPVQVESLKNVLQEKISQTSHLILLQIDRTVPIQHMIQVVDIANSLNAQVSVATKQEDLHHE
jgi:biopolymer transport protein ExbD